MRFEGLGYTAGIRYTFCHDAHTRMLTADELRLCFRGFVSEGGGGAGLKLSSTQLAKPIQEKYSKSICQSEELLNPQVQTTPARCPLCRHLRGACP